MQKPFELIIKTENETHSFSVNPNQTARGGIGQEGSILDYALGLGVEIDHACGGVTACSTCHIYVKEGLASCNENTEAEDDMLDKAPAVQTNSRLACQCIPNGNSKIVVEVPSWNRNLVREGKH